MTGDGNRWQPLFRLSAPDNPCMERIHELSLDGVPVRGVVGFKLVGSIDILGDSLMELHLELLPAADIEASVELVLTKAEHENLQRILEHAKVLDR